MAVVQASIATMPGREVAFQRVVERLLPQVSLLRVYLNQIAAAPAFLRPFEARGRVRIAYSHQHGDRGTAAKFFWTAEASGFQILCDDDIDYPADYVARMIDAVERYRRAAIVGVHGSVLSPSAAVYYGPARRTLHFTDPLVRDAPQHTLGTGTTAYHADGVRLAPTDFPLPYLSDLQLGIAAQRRVIPLIAIARRTKWLRPLPLSGPTHWDRRKELAAQADALLRSTPWQLHDGRRTP